jgi:hypothetical protein
VITVGFLNVGYVVVEDLTDPGISEEWRYAEPSRRLGGELGRPTDAADEYSADENCSRSHISTGSDGGAEGVAQINIVRKIEHRSPSGNRVIELS